MTDHSRGKGRVRHVLSPTVFPSPEWPPGTAMPALAPDEQALRQQLGVQDSSSMVRLQENMCWLSARPRELDAALAAGAYTLQSCREAAVPVMVHLRALGRAEAASAVFREVFPYFDMHRFYPVLHAAPGAAETLAALKEKEQQQQQHQQQQQPKGQEERGESEEEASFLWEVYGEFAAAVGAQYEDAVLARLVAAQLRLLLARQPVAQWAAAGAQLAQHPWCRVLARVHAVDLRGACVRAAARVLAARPGRVLPRGVVALCQCTHLDGTAAPALAHMCADRDVDAARDSHPAALVHAARAAAAALDGRLYARYYALPCAVLRAMGTTAELAKYYARQLQGTLGALPAPARDACVAERLRCATADGLGPLLAAGLAPALAAAAGPGGLDAVVAKCRARVCACVDALAAAAPTAAATGGLRALAPQLAALGTAWRQLVLLLSLLPTADAGLAHVHALAAELAGADARGVCMSRAVAGLEAAIVAGEGEDEEEATHDVLHGTLRELDWLLLSPHFAFSTTSAGATAAPRRRRP